MNVVIVRGRLSRPLVERKLPSGRVADGEVTVVVPEGPAEVVPVSWPEAPARAAQLKEGSEVVVTGRVRRRFFRAGGVTQSRTEVVADAVVPVRQAKKVAALVAEACERARNATSA